MSTSYFFRALIHRSLYFSLIIAVCLIISTACGRNREKRMVNSTPPSLAPAPPKPPSMVGGDTIWNFGGQMPKLPGNEEALYDYIGRNLRYPDSAKVNGIQGKVVVKFCVTSKGNVTGHEVIKSISPDLDAEALRVIKTITKFEPGYMDGKAKTVYYEVPISFVLK
jgi:TonB family protein